MRQNATLRRYRVADDDVVQHMSEVGKRRGVIRSRIYADDRVAAAVHQSVNDAGGNSFQIVGRMDLAATEPPSCPEVRSYYGIE
jgi:hypothetical protein